MDLGILLDTGAFLLCRNLSYQPVAGMPVAPARLFEPG
jgi:hypothetical protein